VVVVKQTGKTKSSNRNFFTSENKVYTATIINIVAKQNRKAYTLGATSELTKEELLRNKVPKQSKKKKITKIVRFIFIFYLDTRL